MFNNEYNSYSYKKVRIKMSKFGFYFIIRMNVDSNLIIMIFRIQSSSNEFRILKYVFIKDILFKFVNYVYNI